jgi:hypothetical protein
MVTTITFNQRPATPDPDDGEPRSALRGPRGYRKPHRLLRGVPVGMAVIALLLISGCTSAEREAAYYRRERAEEATYYAGFAEDAEQARLDDIAQDEYYHLEFVDRADEWADTYLAAEKAVAVYWRDAWVDQDAKSGRRTGRLRTPDGQVISYTCDINYRDAGSGGCVPADRDYDCDELRSWGIVNIRVRTPVSNPRPVVTPPPGLRGDWMLLDDDHDGLACEVEAASE